MNKFFYYFVLLFIASSCSLVKNTTVTKIKNTGFNRKSHGFFSKYNIYHNGLSAIDEVKYVLNNISEQNPDIFIPIFKYDNTPDSLDIYFQYAIKKSLKVIGRHSILEGGYEFSPYVDDAYLLAIEAAYGLGIYDETIELCRYFAANFGYSPLLDNVNILKAKALIKLREYYEAEDILNRTKKNGFSDQEIHKEWLLTKADFFLKNIKIDSTATTVEKSLRLIKKKHEKNRLYFLLFQLYSALGNEARAYKYSKIVQKKSIPYDLYYLSYLGSLQYSPVLTKINIYKYFKRLDRHFENEINSDYKDEIIFTKAIISLRKNIKADAINFLEEAYKISTNNYRKTKYQLKLADIFEEQKNYIKAADYFSLASEIIPIDYYRYNEVKRKADKYSKIKELMISYDSLNQIYLLMKMQDFERTKYYDSIVLNRIEKIKEETRQKRKEILSNQKSKTQFLKELANNSRLEDNKQWYFNNPKVLEEGRKKFQNYWDNRPNVDNWRNQSMIFGAQTSDETVAKKDENIFTQLKTLDSTEKEKIKQARDVSNIKNRIPKTKKDSLTLYTSLEKILFDLGNVYYTELSNYETAKEFFVKTINLIKKGKYEANTFFMLYLIAKKQDYVLEIEKYKGLLNKKYPNSIYTKLVNENVDIESNIDKENESYEDIYSLFTTKDYDKVIEKSELFLVYYKNSKWAPVVMYLKAVSFSRNKKVEDAKKIFLSLLEKYPEDKKVLPKVKKLLKNK